MDEIVYNALSSYINVLEKLGYVSNSNLNKLLVLIFYRDLIMEDYSGILTECDYHCIERALNCLYGSSCLIPYPDYVKMGSLNLGEVSELSQRISALEDANVLKLVSEDPDASDVYVEEQE